MKFFLVFEFTKDAPDGVWVYVHTEERAVEGHSYRELEAESVVEACEIGRRVAIVERLLMEETTR